MTEREKQILNWIRQDPQISQQELAEKAGITRSSVGVHISNLIRQGYITGRGYMFPEAQEVIVVGAVNMDIGGVSNNKLVREDSNPGIVTTSLGGVGRNIAHNMALLGIKTRLLTTFGDDTSADHIISAMNELGVDTSLSTRIRGGRTSTYLFISDEKGDMQLAINDMDIYKHLTPELIEARGRALQKAEAIVIDTNIPKESIEYITSHFNVPIFADPVSTIKASKLKNVLGRLYTLKPNRMEAELLSGVPIRDGQSLAKAARVLLDTGLKRVFISLGADGVFAGEKDDKGEHFVKVPASAGKAVNTTGCGDAFTAALVWAYLHHLDLEDAARAGQAASAITMQSEKTINESLNEGKIINAIHLKEEVQ